MRDEPGPVVETLPVYKSNHNTPGRVENGSSPVQPNRPAQAGEIQNARHGGFDGCGLGVGGISGAGFEGSHRKKDPGNLNPARARPGGSGSASALPAGGGARD